MHNAQELPGAYYETDGYNMILKPSVATAAYSGNSGIGRRLAYAEFASSSSSFTSATKCVALAGCLAREAAPFVRTP